MTRSPLWPACIRALWSVRGTQRKEGILCHLEEAFSGLCLTGLAEIRQVNPLEKAGPLTKQPRDHVKKQCSLPCIAQGGI